MEAVTCGGAGGWGDVTLSAHNSRGSVRGTPTSPQTQAIATRAPSLSHRRAGSGHAPKAARGPPSRRGGGRGLGFAGGLDVMAVGVTGTHRRSRGRRRGWPGGGCSGRGKHGRRVAAGRGHPRPPDVGVTFTPGSGPAGQELECLPAGTAVRWARWARPAGASRTPSSTLVRSIVSHWGPLSGCPPTLLERTLQGDGHRGPLPAHLPPGWQRVPGGGEGPHQRAFWGDRRGGLCGSARRLPWGCGVVNETHVSSTWELPGVDWTVRRRWARDGAGTDDTYPCWDPAGADGPSPALRCYLCG